MTRNGQEFSASPATPAQSSGGGNGNGRDIQVRVAVIESELKHLATKKDIEEVKTLIATSNSSILRWIVGVLIAAISTLSIALIRTFVG